jgi:hypothetical protein
MTGVGVVVVVPVMRMVRLAGAAVVMGVVGVRTVVMMVLDCGLSPFLRDILFGMHWVARFHRLPLVLVVRMLRGIGVVVLVVGGSAYIMSVVAHVSASCWREYVSVPPSWDATCEIAVNPS